MFCYHCGEKIDASMKFCRICGTQIVNIESEKPAQEASQMSVVSKSERGQATERGNSTNDHSAPTTLDEQGVDGQEQTMERKAEADKHSASETGHGNIRPRMEEFKEAEQQLATTVITEKTIINEPSEENQPSSAAQYSAGEHTPDQSNSESTSGSNFSEQIKGTFLQATEKINAMVGETGHIDIKLSDVFSSVFTSHTNEEAENLFITGTKLTTPNERDISTSWPRPWLFSRVFIVFALTYILLSISAYTFENINAIPGLIVIGSFAVPFSLLIFFWETNAPRNISIYEIAKMFFIGGAASLVTTLFLFSFFPVYELDYSGAIIVGIVEEIGKLIIIAYFIYKANSRYILNGLLIGAAIGAGFAGFESAGYAFTFGLMYGDDVMIHVIFSRAWTAIGTHVVWGAISGAALVYVKSTSELTSQTFTNPKFLQLFAVPVILHAVWDMPLYVLHHFNLLYIILIIIAWIFIFTLMSAGLKQIVRIHHNSFDTV